MCSGLPRIKDKASHFASVREDFHHLTFHLQKNSQQPINPQTNPGGQSLTYGRAFLSEQ